MMKPIGSRPGVMYGLCKVHKDTTDGQELPPFRPILSAIRTCTYNLAKFFVPILKEYTTNEYTIKDSFTFAEEVTGLKADHYMVSFDVESLFTNIPLDETIDICVQRLYKRKKKVKGLLKRHFKELLTLATKFLLVQWGILQSDRWCGNGFTSWPNTCQSVPLVS